MRAKFLTAYRFFLRLFAFANPHDEARYFGLGHVLILCTLAPAILTMNLYRFTDPELSPSWYESDIDRFMGKEAPVRPAFCSTVPMFPRLENWG